MFAPEGMENRAMAEGRFFHSPHGGSRALDFTKYDTPLHMNRDEACTGSRWTRDPNC
jgi:hypothetical protein